MLIICETSVKGMPCIEIKESGFTISLVTLAESLTKEESFSAFKDNVSTTKLSDTLNSVSAVCDSKFELKYINAIKRYFIISYKNKINQY